MKFKILFLVCVAVFTSVDMSAQAMFRNSATVPDVENDDEYGIVAYWSDDDVEEIDSTAIFAPDGRRWDEMLPAEVVGFALDTIVELPKLPAYFFRPAVYDHFEFPDTIKLTDKLYGDNPAFRWLEEAEISARSMRQMRHNLFYNHPEKVRYNISMLPQAPKAYIAEINPSDHSVEIREMIINPVDKATLEADKVKKRHWIRNFNASLQFSQAYVSPNWYQGGNDNLNVLGQIYYNVKLNQEFHKNLLFEFTGQYKLGLNSAPDDSLRNYSISDDLLQLNTTFGVKAAKRWYYSFTGQFKTQAVNSYASNTHTLRSAFLSPADLTAGVGMTYNYANSKKTFTFDASLAPLSYNMKICTNPDIDETKYGIKEGHTTYSTYGSTAELKLSWRMSSNISYNSRLFTFSNFTNIQADWENTLQFEINRFLTTKVYAHLRYDSEGVPAEGTKWRKLQVKENLSIVFAYKFSSL